MIVKRPVLQFLCIISLQIIAIRTKDCYNFWTKWRSCPLMSRFPSPQFTCFNSTQHIVFLLNNENHIANVQCQFNIVDIDLIRCILINEIPVIGFSNCLFPTQFIKDVVYDANPRTITMHYERIGLVNGSITVDELSSLKEVHITGLRSSIPITITLKDLPYLNAATFYDNRFVTFSFQNLPILKQLSLANQNLNSVPSALLQNLTQLLLINLRENQLQDLPSDIFSGLHLLQIIHLDQNQFTYLKEEWFHGLTELTFLNVSGNLLSTIPPEFFQSFLEFKHLDISFNVQINLTDNMLSSATYLEQLKVEDCQLHFLPPYLLSNLRFLESVSFANNFLTSLPSVLLLNNSLLENLSVENNGLLLVHEITFSNLYYLKSLVLSRNHISVIFPNTFSHLTSLQTLDLHSNKLKALNPSVFNSLSSLHFLDLSDNNLIHLSDNLFGSSQYLRNVNVSFNSIQRLPVLNWSLHNLLEVDANHNSITTVSLTTISQKQTKVYLKYNPIKTIKIIEEDNSNNYSELIQYFIDDSTLSCDCDLQIFLDFISTVEGKTSFPDWVRMKCSEPTKWRGAFLKSIFPAYTVCPLEDNCPSNCECFMTSKKSVVVNCANKELAHLPTDLPSQTSIVYLNNNSINNLKVYNVGAWQNVTLLYLSNNNISSLHNWVIPPNLQLLAIDGNNISELPEKVMSRVDAVLDFHIFLADNNWYCDCKSIPFKKWFMANLMKIQDANITLCLKVKKDGVLIDSLIRDTPVDMYCMHDPVLSKGQLIATIVSILLISLLIICMAVCYYRYTRTILAFLYSHNLYCNCWDNDYLDEEKMFDAFICYSTTDRDIVFKMMEELEPSYRLCIHDRDWLPGIPISQHIVNSVQNSRRTLILLSKSFLESIWFQVEFHAAYNQMMQDKIHYLILVLVGELDNVSNIEKDLRHLLSTKTYLVWGEKWFWEKLKYALRYQGKKKNDFEMENQIESRQTTQEYISE